MLCSPPPATTLASSCAGSQGFCAPCCRRSSQRSRIHNRPKTGRTLLLHERLHRHPGRTAEVSGRRHPPAADELARSRGLVAPAVPAQLVPIEIVRDIVVRPTPAIIVSGPIGPIIAVVVRHAPAPAVRMRATAAAARHLDDVCGLLGARVRDERAADADAAAMTA